MSINDAVAVFKGTTPTGAVYLGGTRVWPPPPMRPLLYRVADPAYSTNAQGDITAGLCRVFGNSANHRWLLDRVAPLSGTPVDWFSVPLGSRVYAVGMTSGAIADGRVTAVSTASGGKPNVILDIPQVEGFLPGEEIMFQVLPQPVMPPPDLTFTWGAGTGTSQVPESGHMLYFNSRHALVLSVTDSDGTAVTPEDFPLGAVIEIRNTDAVGALVGGTFTVTKSSSMGSGTTVELQSEPPLQPESFQGATNGALLNLWVHPPAVPVVVDLYEQFDVIPEDIVVGSAVTLQSDRTSAGTHSLASNGNPDGWWYGTSRRWWADDLDHEFDVILNPPVAQGDNRREIYNIAFWCNKAGNSGAAPETHRVDGFMFRLDLETDAGFFPILNGVHSQADGLTSGGPWRASPDTWYRVHLTNVGNVVTAAVRNLVTDEVKTLVADLSSLMTQGRQASGWFGRKQDGAGSTNGSRVSRACLRSAGTALTLDGSYYSVPRPAALQPTNYRMVVDMWLVDLAGQHGAQSGGWAYRFSSNWTPKGPAALQRWDTRCDYWPAEIQGPNPGVPRHVLAEHWSVPGGHKTKVTYDVNGVSESSAVESQANWSNVFTVSDPGEMLTNGTAIQSIVLESPPGTPILEYRPGDRQGDTWRDAYGNVWTRTPPRVFHFNAVQDTQWAPPEDTMGFNSGGTRLVTPAGDSDMNGITYEVPGPGWMVSVRRADGTLAYYGSIVSSSRRPEGSWEIVLPDNVWATLGGPQAIAVEFHPPGTVLGEAVTPVPTADWHLSDLVSEPLSKASANLTARAAWEDDVLVVSWTEASRVYQPGANFGADLLVAGETLHLMADISQSFADSIPDYESSNMFLGDPNTLRESGNVFYDLVQLIQAPITVSPNISVEIGTGVTTHPGAGLPADAVRVKVSGTIEWVGEIADGDTAYAALYWSGVHLDADVIWEPILVTFTSAQRVVELSDVEFPLVLTWTPSSTSDTGVDFAVPEPIPDQIECGSLYVTVVPGDNARGAGSVRFENISWTYTPHTGTVTPHQVYVAPPVPGSTPIGPGWGLADWAGQSVEWGKTPEDAVKHGNPTARWDGTDLVVEWNNWTQSIIFPSMEFKVPSGSDLRNGPHPHPVLAARVQPNPNLKGFYVSSDVILEVDPYVGTPAVPPEELVNQFVTVALAWSGGPAGGVCALAHVPEGTSLADFATLMGQPPENILPYQNTSAPLWLWHTVDLPDDSAVPLNEPAGWELSLMFGYGSRCNAGRIRIRDIRFRFLT